MDHCRTKRVMAVEHHPMLRDGLIALLRSQDDIYVVSTVTTAEEALADYLRFLPDVAIIDLHLPGGFELIQKIRRKNPEATIIPLVGYDWNDHSQEVLAASGIAVLPADEIGTRLLDLIRRKGE
jgi:DNA-binding NarL/FixJ family response regulator